MHVLITARPAMLGQEHATLVKLHSHSTQSKILASADLLNIWLRIMSALNVLLIAQPVPIRQAHVLVAALPSV